MNAEGWFRELEDDGLEVFLKAGGVKLRASGPSSDMAELVDWFETKTGASVAGLPTRLRPAPQPMEGQIGLEL